MSDEFGIPASLTKKPRQPAATKPPAEPKIKVLDPEEDKENWPTIFIDFEENKPNYEYLGVSGTMKDGRPFTHSLQVQRGVEVKVPPSIVNMLRTSKEAKYAQTPDPVTGRVNMVRTERSGVPWQLREKGKYC